METSKNKIPAETLACAELNYCIFKITKYDEGLVIDWKKPEIEKLPKKQSILKKEVTAASEFVGTIVGGQVAISYIDAQVDLTRPSTLLLSGLLGGFAGYNFAKEVCKKPKTTISLKDEKEKYLLDEAILGRSRQMESALIIPSITIGLTCLPQQDLHPEFGIGETKLPISKVGEILREDTGFSAIEFHENTSSGLAYRLKEAEENIKNIKKSYYDNRETLDCFSRHYIEYYREELNKEVKKLGAIDGMRNILEKHNDSELNIITLQDLRPDIIIYTILESLEKEERDNFISTIFNELLNMQENITKYVAIQEEEYTAGIMPKLDEKGKEECRKLLSDITKIKCDTIIKIVESILNIIAEKYLLEEEKNRLLMQSELEALKQQQEDNLAAGDSAPAMAAHSLVLESRIRTLHNQLNSSL